MSFIEFLGATQGPAARDDNLSGSELRSITLGDLGTHEAGSSSRGDYGDGDLDLQRNRPCREQRRSRCARTVMTLMLSVDSTVAIALPAKIGRSKAVWTETTLVMSETWATSSMAATRGAMFLPQAVAGNRMWL
jgi:hypothetical protein